jgi:hypothetical protein
MHLSGKISTHQLMDDLFRLNHQLLYVIPINLMLMRVLLQLSSGQIQHGVEIKQVQCKIQIGKIVHVLSLTIALHVIKDLYPH